MIDLETLGTEPNSLILSLAAVEFCEITGKTGRIFYKKIELLSSLTKGFVINKETLLWWTNQKSEQFQELFVNEEPIKSVMQQFIYWFQNNNAIVWANSPSFDLVILGNALKKCGYNVPWKYYNERCVRTLLSLAANAKQQVPKPTKQHNALVDCEYQIALCVEAKKQILSPV